MKRRSFLVGALVLPAAASLSVPTSKVESAPVISLPSGVAATPVFSFASDSNTGFYRLSNVA
jgi:hypothetical protein